MMLSLSLTRTASLPLLLESTMSSEDVAGASMMHSLLLLLLLLLFDVRVT